MVYESKWTDFNEIQKKLLRVNETTVKLSEEEDTPSKFKMFLNKLVKELALSTIDAGIARIQSSIDADWRNPGDNRKAEMVTKLGNLRALVEAGQNAKAYEVLLHDVKPKLTGLKTDEDDVAWGNGVFNNPWVETPALQEEFRLWANALAHGLSNHRCRR